ncbi:MAG: hypothetical protein WCO96_01295 [Actinomycetes bacterium]
MPLKVFEALRDRSDTVSELPECVVELAEAELNEVEPGFAQALVVLECGNPVFALAAFLVEARHHEWSDGA